MAGIICADTLQDGAGNSTAMDNAIYGSAKAWVNFNGNGGATIRASYNVSSVTRTGTGQYTINFTNAMVDANYGCNVTSGGTTNAYRDSIATVSGYSTTSVSVITVSTSVAYYDVTAVNVAIFR
jgi:hypothetical protein